MEFNIETDDIYIRWRKVIARFSLITCLIMVVSESVAGYIISMSGDAIDWRTYGIYHVLMPAIINLICIGLIYLAIFSKTFSNLLKNYVMLTMISIMCFVVSTVHFRYVLVTTLMIMPILAASLFQQKKLLIYTLVISIVFSWLTIPATDWFAALCNEEDGGPKVANIAFFMIIQILAGVICVILNNIYRERELKLNRLKNSHQELEQKVRTDGLTGLLNHTSFYDELERTLMEYKMNHKEFTLVMMDVDNFKQTNDLYGHRTGDELLKSISEILLTKLEGKGTSFRYGGDEFAVIFNTGDVYAVYDMMEECRVAVTELGKKLSENANVNASIGVYVANNPSLEGNQIVERADMALRNAKGLGKGRIHVGS